MRLLLYIKQAQTYFWSHFLVCLPQPSNSTELVLCGAVTCILLQLFWKLGCFQQDLTKAQQCGFLVYTQDCNDVMNIQL